MAQIFPIDFEEKLTMAQDDYILFSDSEDGNKIKKAQYKNLKGEPGTPGTPGQDGQDGAAATITVGSTTTGTPGSSASVTNSGTSSAAVLNFTIPQGAKGETGADGKDGTDGKDGVDGTSATITVGTTTTLPAGSSATVTNSGTSSAAVLNFGIPKGDKGDGRGDVNGPASSTDGNLAVFDGVTGKIIKDGGAIPTGVPSGGTDGQVLSKVSGNIAWANPSGGDVVVSPDTGNELSTGVGLWLGTETDFSSISTPDTNTLYIQYKSDGGGGWQPGANTVLYFPLTSDAVDTIAGVSLSNGGGAVSYVTPTGLSIPCAYFSSAGYLYKNTATSQLPTGASARTISGWIKFESDSRSGVATYGDWSNNKMFNLYVYDNNISSGWRFTQWGAGSQYGSTQPLNTWTNVVVTYDGSNIVWYLNGVQDNSWAYTINTSNSNLYLGTDMSIGSGSVSGGLQGYLSQIIIEDKCWTAQEIADYYNQTKGDYGIS